MSFDDLALSNGAFVPSAAMRVSAVRASGPGGQNVNKVSSKVILEVSVSEIVGLGPAAKSRLEVLAGSRLSEDGELRIVSQRTRERPRNLEDAREKLRELLEAALAEPKPRRKTRPSRGAVRRRLEDKKQNAERKRQRGPLRGE